MKQLTTLVKNLRLRQILTVFIAGLALFITTACNSGVNAEGARPNNPPVQAGGMNNPYKGGGDAYTDKQASTEGDRASLQIKSDRQIALNNESKLIYPGDNAAGNTTGNNSASKVTPQNINQAQPGGLIQREDNIGDRIGDRLDTVKEAFQEAGSFLGDRADEAAARPELQVNPGRE